MIAFRADLKIWIAAQPVDFRKSIHTLSALVSEALKANPYGGDVFVFRSKRADGVKLLAWNGSGMVLVTTTCIHTTPLSASVEDFSTIAATRSTRRFHRLHCLRGGFDAGISYR